MCASELNPEGHAILAEGYYTLGKGVAMRVLGHLSWLMALMIIPTLLQAEPIGWQEAVARLAYERTRAVTCASALKQYGDDAGKAQGALAYGEAKAEMDAVIAGLVVALARAQEPASLPALEARLQRGVNGREALCKSVVSLMPDASGEKSIIVDLVSGALEPLIEAAKEIYLDYRQRDGLTRATIQTQLEATTWPDFNAIKP